MADKKPDSFYDDLDKHKYQPSMSCYALVIFLFFLLLAGGYIVYFSVSQIRARIDSNQTPISQLALDAAESKLQSFLHGNKSTGEQVTITLTDSELTSLLVKTELLAQNDKFSIKDPSVEVSPANLKLTGTLSKPITTHITALTTPIVVDGQLHLQVQSIKAGQLNVPKFLQSSLQGWLERLVTERLNNNQIVYESAILDSHILTLVGHKQ